MLRYKSLIAAASLASGLALTPVQGASAQMWVGTDPAGDVVGVVIDGAGGGSQHLAQLLPARAHGDIRALRARHAQDRVVVGVRFRNINPELEMQHSIPIRTPRTQFEVYLVHTGRRVYEKSLYSAKDDWDAPLRCPGLGVDINLAEDRVRAFVPRACLGRPRWVRVGAATDSELISAANGDWAFDDALRRGRNDNDWGFSDPALGPRLYRG